MSKEIRYQSLEDVEFDQETQMATYGEPEDKGDYIWVPIVITDLPVSENNGDVA
jgi:hypothetical protein